MFKTLRTIPKVGRVMLTGTTLVCVFNKPSMRDKFPSMKWEYTHFSDVDILAHDMLVASQGYYARLYTCMFKDACKAVPHSILRF